MKPVKAVKTKASEKSPEERADELGSEYVRHKEVMNEINKQIGDVTKDIKTLAADSGSITGKERLVTGKVYAVGFQDIDPTVAPDMELARKILSKEIFDKITCHTIDVSKLEALVTMKIISANQLKSMLVEVREGCRRVVVRKV